MCSQSCPTSSVTCALSRLSSIVSPRAQAMDAGRFRRATEAQHPSRTFTTEQSLAAGDLGPAWDDRFPRLGIGPQVSQ